MKPLSVRQRLVRLEHKHALRPPLDAFVDELSDEELDHLIAMARAAAAEPMAEPISATPECEATIVTGLRAYFSARRTQGVASCRAAR